MKTPLKYRAKIVAWQKANPERVTASKRKYDAAHPIAVRMAKRRWHMNNRLKKMADYALAKEAAINMYTNGEATCRHCGQGDIDVLCLDHINNDGAEQRRKLNLSNLYLWVQRNDYPPGLQVLCFNCNMKKEMERRRKCQLIA